MQNSQVSEKRIDRALVGYSSKIVRAIQEYSLDVKYLPSSVIDRDNAVSNLVDSFTSLLPESDVIILDEVVIIKLSGRITIVNCQEIHDLGESALQITKLIIIDLDKVSFVDSAAIGTLVNQALNLNGKPLICSVGLEFRDYPTLIEVVRGMDLQLVIAAASPWSKRVDSTAGEDIPENVVVRRFSQYELRELFRLSRFMVMPLYYVDFQAGVTVILEAMAMQKPVVCSRAPGQTDIIVDSHNGLYVTPQNTIELRAAIGRLLEDEGGVSKMGLKARKQIEQEMSLEHYVACLNKYVQRSIEF